MKISLEELALYLEDQSSPEMKQAIEQQLKDTPEGECALKLKQLRNSFDPLLQLQKTAVPEGLLEKTLRRLEQEECILDSAGLEQQLPAGLMNRTLDSLDSAQMVQS